MTKTINISEELHKKIKLLCVNRDLKMNIFIENALKDVYEKMTKFDSDNK